MEKTIPVIDIRQIYSKDEAVLQGIAEEFAHAYRHYGFAQLKNAPIPKQVISDLFAASEAFHALPHEEKMKIKVNEFMRGFIPNNFSTLKTSTLANVKRPNQSESFIMMGAEVAEQDKLAKTSLIGGDNQWPDLPGFKQMVTNYFDYAAKLGQQLIKIVALALGLEQDALDHLFVNPTVFLRLMCYPPVASDAPEDLYGSAPHTDYGFLTLLLQDEIGGLQVRTINGEWIDVRPEPDTIIINSGDMLRRISNGQFLSTPHRVIHRKSNCLRFSVPLFFDPNVHAVIAPLAQLDEPKFTSVLFGDYVMDKVKRNYAKLGEKNVS